MLVKFAQSAVFKMKINVEKKSFFGKTKKVTHTEYIKGCFASGICDESEVEHKVACALDKEAKNYEEIGYYDVQLCTDIEELYKHYPYEESDILERCAKLTTSIIYLCTLKVADVLKMLDGKQFAQYCKENKIFFTDIS